MKTALITGGNRGIGLETCRQLAGMEFRVLLISRNVQNGESASTALKSEGLNVVFYPLDVVDPDSIERLVDTLKENEKRIDVLVNNAGIYLDEGRRILDIEEEVFQKTLAVNLWGPFRLCRAIIPFMQRNQYGRIVNLSSGYGSITYMGAGPEPIKYRKLPSTPSPGLWQGK